MAHWNYRVFKQNKDGRIVYSVRDVYYDDNNKTLTWSGAGERLDDHLDPYEMLSAVRTMAKDIERSIDDIIDSDSKPESDDFEI